MGQQPIDINQLLIGESTAIQDLRTEIFRVARGNNPC